MAKTLLCPKCGGAAIEITASVTLRQDADGDWWAYIPETDMSDIEETAEGLKIRIPESLKMEILQPDIACNCYNASNCGYLVDAEGQVIDYAALGYPSAKEWFKQTIFLEDVPTDWDDLDAKSQEDMLEQAYMTYCMENDITFHTWEGSVGQLNEQEMS